MGALAISRAFGHAAAFRIVGGALGAQEHKLAAALIRAVLKFIRRCRATLTLANCDSIRGELHVHALIEHVERALPQGLIAVLFAVAHNTAVDLVDFFKTAVLHEG